MIARDACLGHNHIFVVPALNRVFGSIRERKGLSSLFVCEDVTQNLEAMSRTSADNLSVDEQISIPHLRGVCGAAEKFFGGNLHPTSALLKGFARVGERIALVQSVGGAPTFEPAAGDERGDAELVAIVRGGEAERVRRVLASAIGQAGDDLRD